MKPNIKRLTKLADILDTADAIHRERGEPTYDQDTFVHTCGTPACALGHWAAAHPRRWYVESYESGLRSGLKAEYRHEPWGSEMQEFGLSTEEAEELFGSYGCKEARTAKQAARYIRKFIKRKERESSASGDPNGR